MSPSKANGFLNALKIEYICVKNYIAFGRRHFRYITIAFALTLAGIPHWRKRRVIRTGFCFLQVVDDFLDGDRECAGEPLELVEQLVKEIKHDNFSNSEISMLAKAFRSDLLKVCGPEALGEVIKLIRVMQFDRRRVLGSLLLTAEELQNHHRATFQHSIDLMIMAFESPLRSDKVPELVDAFCWCSIMRDLEEDLDAGLVNIPKEVIDEAYKEGACLTYFSLLETVAVQDWMAKELLSARELLDKVDVRLSELKEYQGASVLTMFARSIRSYAVRKLPARYPNLRSL